MQRRNQSKQHGTKQRQHHRPQQHVPVQFGMEREPLLTVCQELCQRADADDGDEDAERTAERRQENTFGEELTNDAPAPGAEAESNRYFARPCGGPGE